MSAAWDQLSLAPHAFLGLSQALLANAIGPVAFFLPGFLFLSLSAAFPATVLAAVLERPFISRAGVKQDAIWYSLQANLLSASIGIVCMPLAWCLPMWPLVAVTVSIYSEGWYYERYAVNPGDALTWGWVVMANLFSAAVLFAMAPILVSFSESRPELYFRTVERLEPYHARILWSSVSVSVLAFAWSFVATIRGRRLRKAHMQQPSPGPAALHADNADPKLAARNELL